MKKVLNVLASIVIGIILVYLCICAYSRYTGTTITIGNYQIYQVATGSMIDTLYPGDYILVEKVDSYGVGDIVTYRDEGGNYITHRIVSTSVDNLTTKGDANSVSDLSIDSDAIVGRVVRRLPVYGMTMKIFSNNYFVAIVIVLLMVVIAIPTRNNKNNEEEKKGRIELFENK